MTDWSRRAVLASLGAAAIAGCLSDDGETPADPTDDGLAGTDPGTGTGTPPGTDTGTDRPPGTGTSADGTDTGTDSAAGGTPTVPDSIDSAWPVPGADAGRSNAVSAAGPTDPVAELWRVDAGVDLSPPVVAGESLYASGEDGRVRALDARTGERRWTADVDTTAGTPWAVGDRLYVPVSGEVVALSPADGREVWRVETAVRQGLLVADHGVYWVDERGPAVVALSPADGSEVWRTDIAQPWTPHAFASDDTVFVSSGTSDNRFWRLAAADGDVLNDRPRDGADFPAERYYRDGTVYAVDAFFGNVRATSVGEGGHSWYEGVPYGGGSGTIAGDDDRAYYASNAEDEPELTALSTTDGSTAWTAEVPSGVGGRPAVTDETLLVPTGDGLLALDPADGTERWSRPVDTGRGFAVADDLVFASVDGGVTAFRPP